MICTVSPHRGTLSRWQVEKLKTSETEAKARLRDKAMSTSRSFQKSGYPFPSLMMGDERVLRVCSGWLSQHIVILMVDIQEVLLGFDKMGCIIGAFAGVWLGMTPGLIKAHHSKSN